MTNRYAKPIADSEVVAWSPSSGSTLYDKIAETVADDAGFINPTAVVNHSTFKLSPLQQALDGTLVVSYRVKSPDGVDLTAQLLEGTTVIATRTHTGIQSAAYATLRMELTALEASAIGDYSNLYIKFVGDYSVLLAEDGTRLTLEDGTSLLLMEKTA